MRQLLNYIGTAAAILNNLAAAAVVAMMLLTTLDVALRFLRCPIPGTYEIIGFLGALVIAFSLAGTSLSRGHIAVDFLVRKLPAGLATFIERLNLLVCTALFLVLTRYLLAYAGDMRRAGEVSMTLQIPLAPFIYGIAIGCAALCAVFVAQLLYSFNPSGHPGQPEAKR